MTAKIRRVIRRVEVRVELESTFYDVIIEIDNRSNEIVEMLLRNPRYDTISLSGSAVKAIKEALLALERSGYNV